jgi:hypothetical protein
MQVTWRRKKKRRTSFCEQHLNGIKAMPTSALVELGMSASSIATRLDSAMPQSRYMSIYDDTST